MSSIDEWNTLFIILGTVPTSSCVFQSQRHLELSLFISMVLKNNPLSR